MLKNKFYYDQITEIIGQEQSGKTMTLMQIAHDQIFNKHHEVILIDNGTQFSYETFAEKFRGEKTFNIDKLIINKMSRNSNDNNRIDMDKLKNKLKHFVC